jgi:Phytanoyl-CoA dioxygenase (PhyH)
LFQRPAARAGCYSAAARPAAMRSLLARLRRPSAAVAGALTGQGRLASDLWLDRPDAGERVEAARRRGRLSAAEAENLRRFSEEGYLTFALDLPDRLYAEVDQAVDRLWREKPARVAYAYHSQLRPFAFADEAAERKPSYRIADLHAYSAAALDLYLDPEVFRWVDLILGEAPVATQSLTFEFGSQQALHRDPVFVQTRPPSHLVAAWIALEDIDPRSGPLVYVPGSHRLPYYQFAPGEHRFDHRYHGVPEIRAMEEFDRQNFMAAGMEVRPFTPRRGEVLIWHHSLLHGGSASEDLERTRKSFVVHFSTRRTFTRLKQTYLERVRTPEEEWVERPRIVETESLLERDGRAGFDSPLARVRLRGVPSPSAGSTADR